MIRVQELDMRLIEAIASDAYVEVRRRIFRQLLESAIFEKIVSVETVKLGKETLFIVHGRDADGTPVTYNCRGSRRLTFGRIRLHADSVLRISKEGKQEADSLELFLQEVIAFSGADGSKLSAFAAELERTLLNDTLAQYEKQKTGKTLQGKGSYDELETSAMDGHPYHPSYKSRIGFTPQDGLAFGPESGEGIRPLWIAIRREEAAMAVSKELTFRELWRSELGEGQLAEFEQKLKSCGTDLDQVALLPVHPWQWRNVAAPSLMLELRNGSIIPLGLSQDEYRPQQSIRTLVNHSDAAKPYMKLSLSLLNTSSYRHIEPHYAAVAPAISEWLQGLVDADPYLKQEAKVILLKEFAGIGYDPIAPASSINKGLMEGALSCVWRERLEPHLLPGELAVPFHALTALDIDGKPFIDPWLQATGIHPWLTRLFESCVLPVAHLLIAHGVALESHAQNMVMIHSNGVPARAALKDFHEDAMFCRTFLDNPAVCPPFHTIHRAFAEAEPFAFFEQEKVDPLRYLLLGALYFINLGELAILLSDRYNYSETRFWELAVDTLDAHLRKYPALLPRFQQLNVYAPTTRLEQLTKKRLFVSSASLMHEVPSPLYSVREQMASVGGKENITC
ncbi:siderophore biosynthesis protein [Paenibacillus oenotherae]|uniref:Siderophore biosynthesis protein n=1 Tax=Paenibacillus oenotherae TaxID=1435645 RepID=A0ABS7D4U0_9BACL|nr:IucA/IucC family protein [Paenibacillus oenotherae]MBW7474900.1 siderophore biosynthesis protein [Paenibacillus oenotherae]